MTPIKVIACIATKGKNTMELLLVFLALFVFFFGSAVAMKLIDFGIRVGDKTLESSGTLMKLPFVIAFKGMCFAGNSLYNFVLRVKPKEYKVTPIISESTADVQFASFNNQLRSKNRQPVQIEYPQHTK